MAHDNHWFKCCHCGYIGEEKELPQIDILETGACHECGDDKCPKCKNECCIICCFESYEKAEDECNDNKDCWCDACSEKYSSKTGDKKNG